jgi:hypothetical protein
MIAEVLGHSVVHMTMGRYRGQHETRADSDTARHEEHE